LIVANLHVLSIRIIESNINILSSIDLEAPLEAVLQDGDGGSAGTSTLEANLITSAIHSVIIRVSPVDSPMSYVVGHLGCHYSDALFRQTNVDRVSDIQGQEHRKVDCLQMINAKLSISLLCT